MVNFDLNALRVDSGESFELKVSSRKDVLEKITSFYDYKGQNDSYAILREERWFNIKPVQFLGPHLKDVTANKVFSRLRYRVPEISLSRYTDASVLPHYIIVTKEGKISQDSYEEYTVEEDNSWFSDDMAFVENGKRFCIPRVRANPHWLERNKFDFSYAQNLPVEHINSPVLYLMAWHHKNVSHWFLDVLSRVWGNSFIPKKDIKIIVPAPLHPYMRECLHLLGFATEDIIEAKKDRVYKFKELYCVSRLASQYNFISPECTDFFSYMKNTIPSFRQSKNKRLYISRRDTTRRMCVNEDKLENILKKKGFEIVQTTPLNLKERIELFSEAEFIAGPCGAGMFHSLFMPSDSKVFVTGTPEMNKNSCAFNYIGMHKNQDVYIYSGKNIDNKNTTMDNWKLDIDSCVDAIDCAIKY